MEWYYAIGKEQKGPVTMEQLTELVRQGVVQGSTLVWCKGMTDWLPYEKVAAAPGTPPVPGMAPALPYAEGLPSPEAWAEQVKETPADINVGECFGKGWEMFQRNMPVTIGVFVLFMLINMSFGFIPLLGFFLSLFLTGPLMGGFLYYFVLLVRGEECQVGNAFAGFGPQFVPLMLTGLLITFVSALCVLPVVGALIFLIISAGIASQSPANLPQVAEMLSVGMIIALVGLTLLCVLIIVLVSVMLQFSYPLILDKRVDLMVAFRLSVRKCYKNLFPLLLLLFLGWLLNIAGALLCGVGLLFTTPWFVAALAVAYEKLFPGATAKVSY